jgi:hypothetical protein
MSSPGTFQVTIKRFNRNFNLMCHPKWSSVPGSDRQHALIERARDKTWSQIYKDLVHVDYCV